MPYNKAENTKSITVQAVAVTVDVSPKYPWTAGQTITITATLTKDGAAWPGETVTFIFGSPAQDTLPEISTTEIGSAVTGADGKAVLTYTIPWSVGGAQVPCRRINYYGAWHKPSNVYKWYGPGAIAFPTRISITAPDKVAPGQAFTISGKLEYQNTPTTWAGLAGKTVSLYYDTTKIADVTTGSDGSYSASASIPSSGTYTLKAVYAGEGFALAATFGMLGLTVERETLVKAVAIAVPLAIGSMAVLLSRRA
mgnify:CR=1 FL=1